MAFRVNPDLNRAVSITLVTGRNKSNPDEVGTHEAIFLPGARIPDNVAPWIVEAWHRGNRRLRRNLVVDDGGVPEVIDSAQVFVNQVASAAVAAVAPAMQAEPQSEVPAAIDYASLDVEALKQLAADRGLEVTRGDGKEGAPLKADYVAALQASDVPAESQAPVNPFQAAAA